MRDLTFKTLKTIFSYYKGETLNNINYYLICIGRYIILRDSDFVECFCNIMLIDKVISLLLGLIDVHVCVLMTLSIQ